MEILIISTTVLGTIFIPSFLYNKKNRKEYNKEIKTIFNNFITYIKDAHYYLESNEINNFKRLRFNETVILKNRIEHILNKYFKDGSIALERDLHYNYNIDLILYNLKNNTNILLTIIYVLKLIELVQLNNSDVYNNQIISIIRQLIIIIENNHNFILHNLKKKFKNKFKDNLINNNNKLKVLIPLSPLVEILSLRNTPIIF
jgi:hypothetical protein